MHAKVQAVRRDVQGSVLAATLTIGDTSVQVVSARDFTSSGSLQIGTHIIAYTGILWAEDGDAANDTLTLAGTSPVGGTALVTRVDVPGSVEFVATVRVEGSGRTTDATLRHHMRKRKQLAVAPFIDPPVDVRVEADDDGRLWVVDLLHVDPTFGDDDFTSLSSSVTTLAGEVAAIGGVAGGLFAYFDGGLNGATPFAFTDGGLFT